MPAKIIILDSKQGYDLAADNYDLMTDYLNSFEKGEIPLILKNVKGKKILDVGAGTGRLSLMLSHVGAEVTALDISAKMLAILKRKNHSIKTVVADAESLPFENETFDLVTAAFFIVHLSNPKRFFEEAYRVLKPSGELLITNINQKDPPEVKTPVGKIKIESYYHRPDKIKQMLEDLAFNVKETIIKEKDVWINQMILAKK